jgi:Protein of unknown function (DUF2591)
MKTTELTGAALDWAVAKCEGAENTWGRSRLKPYEWHKGHSYSTEWAQGGRIIERERLSIECTRADEVLGIRWMAESTSKDYCTQFAEKPLIAAMRCYVASKLGDEVEIPTELITN